MTICYCSVTYLRLILCDSMDCGTPCFPALHSLLEFAQTHVHRVSDAIQPSHSLSSFSPLALNLFQHQGLFQWIERHQVAKVLEHQPQHQSFQWIFMKHKIIQVLLREDQWSRQRWDEWVLETQGIIGKAVSEGNFWITDPPRGWFDDNGFLYCVSRGNMFCVEFEYSQLNKISE